MDLATVLIIIIVIIVFWPQISSWTSNKQHFTKNRPIIHHIEQENQFENDTELTDQPNEIGFSEDMHSKNPPAIVKLQNYQRISDTDNSDGEPCGNHVNPKKPHSVCDIRYNDDPMVTKFVNTRPKQHACIIDQIDEGNLDYVRKLNFQC
jgi:hypothetical protein